MSKIQSIIDVLDSLELFASEKGFPMRVLDSVRELKEEAGTAAGDAQTEQLILETDELIRHIGKKYAEKESEELPLEVNRVSSADVEERVREILSNCKMENKEMLLSYTQGQSAVITEAAQWMQEILNTRAHYNELKNMGRFCGFFTAIENRMQSRTADALQAFTEALCKSYDSAMTKLRGLFTKLKDEKFHVRQRDFYMEYDNKYDLIKQRIRTKGMALAQTGREIQEFAAGCVEPLSKLKKKQERKRNRYIFLPLVVIVILFFLFTIVPKLDFQSKGAGSEREETSVSTEINMLKEGMQEVKELIGNKAGQGNIELWAIVGLIYFCYITYILNQSRKWFCDDCAEFLTPKIQSFLQENNLQDQTEGKFEELYKEFEDSYTEMFEGILGHTESALVRTEKEEFEAILESWKAVKRMA